MQPWSKSHQLSVDETFAPWLQKDTGFLMAFPFSRHVMDKFPLGNCQSSMF